MSYRYEGKATKILIVHESWSSSFGVRREINGSRRVKHTCYEMLGWTWGSNETFARTSNRNRSIKFWVPHNAEEMS